MGAILGKIYEEGFKFNINKKMDVTKQATKTADQAVQKMRWYDISLVKISVAAFALMVAKLWPTLLSLKWWVYLIIFVVAAIKPLYSAYLKN